tara:strand:+ start:822 stop:1028 length:207 start_codon:yes stop_codon:yes gene_type:complete
MKNYLLVSLIICISAVIFLGMGTYPEYKIFSLFGYQFGVNINEYMLLKIGTLTIGFIYLLLRYKKNGV